MKEICAICSEVFEDEDFVKHLRGHKIKAEDYYVKYHPKNDLFSGEQIRYKNREFYQSSLFNTRTNMVKYLKTLGNSALHQLALSNIINLRQSVKHFAYAPSTIEARTSILPSPLLFQEYSLDYNKAWKQAGAVPRYDYKTKLSFGSCPKSILVDTREQKPLSFDCPKVTTVGLKYGDYATDPSCGIVIERKSLNDLCGTLSAGYERFQREIERAVAANEMLIVCVETDASTLTSYNYLPHMRRIKASPEFICHRMRELCQKYPQVQFLLCKNRQLMSPTIQKIFSLLNKPQQIDFQFHFDRGDFV